MGRVKVEKPAKNNNKGVERAPITRLFVFISR
jgi:hypothetical protein